MLFCREKLWPPAGCLPLAFSDMPRSCVGTASSTDTTEDARDGFSQGLDCEGVGRCSSSLSSSSSPIANVSSSGTFSSVDARERDVVGLLRLSTELLVELPSSPSAGPPSFLRWFRRSISSCPLSRVKLRNASKRFLYRTIAYTKSEFSVEVS